MNGLTSILSVIIGAIITILFGLIIGSFRYTFLKNKELLNKVDSWLNRIDKVEKQQNSVNSDIKLIFTLIDAIRETLVRKKVEIEIEMAKIEHEIKQIKKGAKK